MAFTNRRGFLQGSVSGRRLSVQGRRLNDSGFGAVILESILLHPLARRPLPKGRIFRPWIQSRVQGRSFVVSGFAWL